MSDSLDTFVRMLARGDAARHVDFRGADMPYDLRYVKADDCDFRSVSFHSRNLYGSVFTRCDFSGANFKGANLQAVTFVDCQIDPKTEALTSIVPATGSFEAWKKGGGGEIIRLRIPADAKRVGGYARKCRASRATVLEIVDAFGRRQTRCMSWWQPVFEYVVGATVECQEPFDPNPIEWCASGIHFYMSRAEAEAHEFG